MVTNEKGPALLIAYQHFDLLEAKDIRTLGRGVDRLLAALADKLRATWMVLLLSCRRMAEPTKVLPAIEDTARHGCGWLKKRPIIVFYHEKSGHALKFGETPEHEHMERILKLLLNP